MSTETLWRTLRTSWWIIALGAIAGLILGLLILQVAPKQYESASRVLIQPSGDSGSGDLQTQQSAVTEMLPTYIAIAGADKGLDATSERLDGSVDATALRDDLLYVAEEDTPIITVTGHGRTPDDASAMADAGATTLADAVDSSYSGDLDVPGGHHREGQCARRPLEPRSEDPAARGCPGRCPCDADRRTDP
jgi:succinoglycan biosynthesis transport protein ExoP